MKIVYESLDQLFEKAKNISPDVLIVEKGTELFHGTGEEFDIKDLHPGGYDSLLWTALDSAIAQTYIPDSGAHYYIHTESISYPSNDPTMQNIQKLFGIDYDYSKIEFKGKQAKSYFPAPIFKPISDKAHQAWQNAYKKYQELEAFKKSVDKNDYDNQTDEFFDTWTKLEDEYQELLKIDRQFDEKKYMNNYVNEKLKDLGYKPTSENSDGNFNWKVKIGDDTIQPANYKHQGRLLIITPNRDLKIFDNTLGGSTESDLTDLEYHKHNLFDKARNEGYDGIKINDFAQSVDQGNFAHTSIGLFKKTLKDVTIQEIPAVHQELETYGRETGYETPEYKSFKNKK